ncbi:MAG: 50S ribosomal protein L1 [Actinomycetota bacterium]|jgi:large subunit ribosomal protein L1|nr:50S ribosomal protein L1 [Acidobacteriota bacterium]
MAKHGKRYDDAKAQINPEGNYHPLEAFRLLVSQEVARFDTTVEAHFRLGVNVRHAEEQLRGTIALPHGTGRAVTVAVFAEGEKAREAEEAGAQIVGGEDLVKRVEEGFSDFDVAIATPDMMGAVGRLGRVLGPSGKMPNPKTGTVTFDVGKAVTDVIGGKVEYRTDRAGIVHIGLGKKSFTAEQLTENYAAILDEIMRAKPASTKGKYIKSISVAQTMGPGIDIDPQYTQNLLEEATA